MEPGYDDLADTLTASLRTARAIDGKLDALAEMILSIMTVVGLVFTVWMATKVWGSHGSQSI